MSSQLREYRKTHHGGAFPLLDLQREIRERGELDAHAIDELGRKYALPAATVRAAITFYDNLGDDPSSVRLCRGTSCMLAGGSDAAASQNGAACSPVYCLGFCDRSPAILRPDGQIEVGAGGAPPAPTSIRAMGCEPIVTGRMANGDASDIKTAQAAGAYEALRRALDLSSMKVVEIVEQSGLRGRGGAGFPTGMKWRTCAEQEAPGRYVVANGDEGDPGVFIDRVLMELDPHAVIEGMILCAYAVGAEDGIVFIRSEYPTAINRMRQAIEDARSAGFLGIDILGSGFDFDMEIFPALGSYVCGEETALLNAIEGFRGEVSLRPPYPAQSGLYGLPTVVNNIETLVNVPWILTNGPEAYRAMGTEKSSGTKAICLDVGFANPGIVEVEFGVTMRKVIEEAGGGSLGGTPLDAVLLGGPMGSIVPPEEWDVPICFSAMADVNIQLGHGGIVALPEGTDYYALLTHLLEFMKDESCGKCVPCSIGSVRASEMAKDLRSEESTAEFRRLLDVIEKASLCAFGQLMPGPIGQILDRFGESVVTHEV